MEYDREVSRVSVTPDAFEIQGRTIITLYTSKSCAMVGEKNSADGKYVIIELDGRDCNANTIVHVSPDKRHRVISTCAIRQSKTLIASGGALILPWERFLPVDYAVNEVFDQFRPGVYVDRKNGNHMKYQLFLPRDYHVTGSYPLILFFHGGGEKGDDNFAPLLASQGGSIWAFDAVAEEHPAVVLVPQCPAECDWIDPDTYELGECFYTVCRLLFSVMDKYAIDKERIYCTGLSMGSMAVWEINKRYPHLFAASIMCVGQGNYEGMEVLRDANIWAFHGENDDKAMPGVVDIMQTLVNAGANVVSDVWDGTLRGRAAETLAKRQIDRGADIMHTQFREGTIREDWVHVGGWKPVYSNRAVRAWLFSKRNEHFSIKYHCYGIQCFREPVRVAPWFSGGEIIEISCGARHNLALKNDGSVWSWGFNGSGQLGRRVDGRWPDTGAKTPKSSSTSSYEVLSKPGMVIGLSNIIQVAAGNNFSLALDKWGNVYGWGCNNCGQLGNPHMENRFSVPMKIPQLCNIVEIGAGDSYGAALGADGHLWTWGSGCSGQLGQDSYFRSCRPLRVLNPDDPSGFLENVRHLKAGIRSIFALTADNKLYGWGDGEYGQLGNGQAGHGPGVRLPQVVLAAEEPPSLNGRPQSMVKMTQDGLLRDVVDVASGRCFTLALKEDGSLYSFGLNRHGECAQPDAEICVLPSRIAALDSVRQIAAGMNHGAVLKSDGTVWTWGYNKLMGEGVLGTPVMDFTSIPVQVASLPKIERIYSGLNHMLALAVDGSLWGWGNGNDGRI